MPGIYAILGEEIVNLPYAFGVNLYHLGERLDIERSSFSRFCRSLNMGNGVLDRSLVWHRPEVEIEVAFRRYCSLQNKHLAVQEIRITSSADTELEFESFIDVGVTTNGYNHLIRVEGRCQDGLKVCIETDTNQKAGFYTFCDGEGLGQPEYAPLDENRRIREMYRVVETRRDSHHYEACLGRSKHRRSVRRRYRYPSRSKINLGGTWYQIVANHAGVEIEEIGKKEG